MSSTRKKMVSRMIITLIRVLLDHCICILGDWCCSGSDREGLRLSSSTRLARFPVAQSCSFLPQLACCNTTDPRGSSTRCKRGQSTTAVAIDGARLTFDSRVRRRHGCVKGGEGEKGEEISLRVIQARFSKPDKRRSTYSLAANARFAPPNSVAGPPTTHPTLQLPRPSNL